MDEDFLINIDIAGKKYPLTIKRKEEELYRKAAKRLNTLMGRYGARYGHNEDVDTKDLLAMVAFHFAKNCVTLEERNDTSPFTEKIQELTTELEGYLKG